MRQRWWSNLWKRTRPEPPAGRDYSNGRGAYGDDYKPNWVGMNESGTPAGRRRTR